MIVRIRGHKIVLGDVLVWLCGTAVALLWFIPIWWMVSTSLKPSDTILTTTVEWLPRAPTLANNDFLWPLLITISEPMQTLAVGMAKFRQNVFRWEDYGAPMAAMTLLAAPTMIVFLVLQRFFVEGVRMTGIKG
ncbi:hypothetical protein [Candidatus Entotheonella palauensis]|uniref:hypothetical protein n=1 Tax=Candidatus Entotheonella palauensis TaxID=93172 RepID=UPI000B7F1EB4|nr:hypothetical protein [Candidatus Entotheonella palauensis]